jgi:SAM-dependent methyltransferase
LAERESEMGYACPVCDGRVEMKYGAEPDLVFRATRDLSDWYRCERCGSLSIQPCVPQAVLAKYYRSNYSPHLGRPEDLTNMTVRDGPTFVLSEMRHRLRTDSPRVLDLGCGNGWFMFNVKKLYPRATVEGVDYRIEYAERNLHGLQGVHLTAGGLEAFRARERFDVIASFQVLEHLQRPEGYVEVVKRCAKEGCLVFTDVPRCDSALALRFGNRWVNMDTPRHRVLYTRGALRALFEPLGALEMFDYGYVEDVISSVFLSVGLRPEFLMGVGRGRILRRIAARLVGAMKLVPLDDRTVVTTTYTYGGFGRE